MSDTGIVLFFTLPLDKTTERKKSGADNDNDNDDDDYDNGGVGGDSTSTMTSHDPDGIRSSQICMEILEFIPSRIVINSSR